MTKRELQQRIGRNLVRLRTERKLTQEIVAEKAGISTTHYANLECGNKSTSVLTLYRIAEVLGASTDAILQEHHTDSRSTVITNALNNQSSEKIAFIEKLVMMCLSELPPNPPLPESQSNDTLEVKL